jgi:tetratricopeptide (TPR) repeat protein
VKRALGAVAVLTVVLLVVSGVARAADQNAEKARAHFQQGDTYFKLEKYANALQEFEQAYLAKQDPSFLYNIAQCHRLMGNRADAVRFYKRYLADAPAAANRPVAEKHIRDLESALGAEELTGAHVPPAPVRPGPNAPGAGMPAPREATPTSPPPVVALDARPPSTPDAVLTAPPPPSPSDDHPIYTKWWFWTGVGGVVVAGLLVALLLSGDPSCPGGRTCQ